MRFTTKATFTLVVVATILLGSPVYISLARGQDGTSTIRDRVVTYSPVPIGFNPVEITQVAVGDKAVRLGTSFSAGDEFVKGLSFTLKNVYRKRIAFIELKLKIPVKNNKDIGHEVKWVSIPLRFGTNPAMGKTPDTFLIPGESATLSMNESIASGLEKMLSLLSPDRGRIDVAVDLVVFDDDTTWRLGFIHRRDLQNPQNWNKTTEGQDQSNARLSPQSKYSSNLAIRNFVGHSILTKSKAQLYCYYRYDGSNWQMCNISPEGYLCASFQEEITLTSDPNAGWNYEGYTFYSCQGWFDPQATCSQPLIGSRVSACV